MVVRLFVTSAEVIKIVNDAYCCFIGDFFPLSFFCKLARQCEDSIFSLLMFKLHCDVAFFFFACLHLARKCVGCASGRGIIYGRAGDVQSVKKP